MWPETAVPGFAGLRRRRLADRLARSRARPRATLVVGAVGVEPLAPRRRCATSTAASCIATRRRAPRSLRQDASRAVRRVRAVARSARALRRRRSRAAPRRPTCRRAARRAPSRCRSPSGATLTAGVPICYELLFPDVVRRFVRPDDRGGAELLLAITNDAWYGRTGAPYQFLVMTAMRSAENRVWTARAANTGVSALIDRSRSRAHADRALRADTAGRATCRGARAGRRLVLCPPRRLAAGRRAGSASPAWRSSRGGAAERRA